MRSVGVATEESAIWPGYALLTGPDDQEDQKNPGGDTINPTGVSVATPLEGEEAEDLKKTVADNS